MSTYKYQVSYQMDMVAGVLKGMKHIEGRMRFVEWHTANEFAVTCDGKTVTNECIGSGAYIKSAPILEAI